MNREYINIIDKQKCHSNLNACWSKARHIVDSAEICPIRSWVFDVCMEFFPRLMMRYKTHKIHQCLLTKLHVYYLKNNVH